MTAASIIRIVDDDPNIHDALAYVLENEGFIVRHYESAESFLINDRPEDPGCAILDVRMGEMSGIVLHDRMKKLGSKLPCIFLSAHGDVDMAVDAIEAGAVTFLSKPVRTEKLLAAIERALTIAQSLASGDPGQTLDGTPASETALTDEAARQAALTEAARTAFSHSQTESARRRFLPSRDSPTGKLLNALKSLCGPLNFIGPVRCANSDAIPPLSSRPSSRWCLKQERPLNKYLGFVPKAETNFHKFELPRNSAVDNKFLFIWVC